MNAADILERAAGMIERRGHCANGHYVDMRGGVCAYGAMRCADGLAPDCDWSLDTKPVLAAWAAIFYFVRPKHISVIDWNDSSDGPTVVAGLRAVAATLRAQEKTEPVREQVTA